MVRKWSYLKHSEIGNSAFWDLHFKPLSRRHTFKVFKKTTRFKRHNTGLSTVVRLKTMKITRKTEKITLSAFISLWSRVYMRSRQFYRYYQAIGLFNTVIPTFSPDSVKAILLKSAPVANIFYFSCSKNVMRKYLTGYSFDKKIKSPVMNSRNSYVASVGLTDLQDFDKISSSILFLDENFFMSDEVVEQTRLKFNIWSRLNGALHNNTLVMSKILRQVLIKTVLHSLFKK